MSLDRPIPLHRYEFPPKVGAFTLASSDVEDGEPMDPKFAHPSVGGKNVSPELHWSGFPEETKGFVVTTFDPDAPTGSGFWHWALVGLPPNVTELPQGAGSGSGLPQGAFHVRNDYGQHAYGGTRPWLSVSPRWLPAGARASAHAVSAEWMRRAHSTSLGSPVLGSLVG
jgi:phosphatidylethanolamine-binding protein (PEBP) family uncharacterized protein